MKCLVWSLVMTFALMMSCEKKSEKQRPNIGLTQEGDRLGVVKRGKAVLADFETLPVYRKGKDVVDDPAIWLNQAHPKKSRILVTDKGRKKGGLLLYDLNGRRVAFFKDPGLNNVDVVHVPASSKSGFAGKSLIIAGRRMYGGQIGIYHNVGSDSIEKIDRGQFPYEGIYGSCAAYDELEDRILIWVNNKSGRFTMFTLRKEGQELVMDPLDSFAVTSQPEGCVVDVSHRRVFVGEEGRGIWSFPFDSSASVGGDLKDSLKSPYLVEDIEGMSIWRRGSEAYLMVSSQGSFSYPVFDISKDFEFLVEFHVADGDIDGTEDTDGLDIISDSLSPQFPRGVVVIQDGHNDGQRSHGGQNVKMIAWDKVRLLW